MILQVSLEKIKSIHIVGIAGTLMGSFAIFLKRMGFQVSGSDSALYPPMSDQLSAASIRVLLGYSAENILQLGYRPDLVILGNVLRKDNPEARAAIDNGFEYSSLPEALEKFFLTHTRNIVVAGTHGKTTTTSLMAHVFSLAGLKPSYFIGGVPKNLPYSFHVEAKLLEKSRNPGKSVENTDLPFILEGDEYDTAFWDKVPKFFHYLPHDAVLTSVEYDHADIYPSIEEVVKAFEGLFERITAPAGSKLVNKGCLTLCMDFPLADRVLKIARKYAEQKHFDLVTYSAQEGADFWCQILSEGSEGMRFRILPSDAKDNPAPTGAPVEFTLPLSGGYNALNATSVYLVAKRWGISESLVQGAFSSFSGVKRRQEERGEVHGRLVIDDFAHHPTAVKETLKGLRAKYQGRRLLVAFEPRSATSRRAVFQSDYADAFSLADQVFIGEPYDQSRIAEEDRFSSQKLIADLRSKGVLAEILPFSQWQKEGKEEEIGLKGAQQIWSSSRPGDLLVILSNGGFYGIIPSLLKSQKT